MLSSDEDDIIFTTVKTPQQIVIQDSNSSNHSDTSSDDDQGAPVQDDSEESSSSDDDDPIPIKKSKIMKPAWVDRDDQNTDIEEKVAAVFGATPKFLDVLAPQRTRLSSSSSSSNDEEDSDEETSGPPKANFFDVMFRDKKVRVGKDIIEVKQCVDANINQRGKSSISTVLFHPKIEALMTASEDTSISVFKIDGKSNEKMFTKSFKSHPIKCARFTPDGNQIIFSANKRHFNVLDLLSSKLHTVNTIAGLPQGEKLSTIEISPCGQRIAMAGLRGRLYIFDAKSRVKTCTCEVSGSIESMTFSHDGQFLYLIGSGNVISVMDIRNTKVPFQRSWFDEGSVGGKSIAASPNNKWIATGSYSGVVNLYPWVETCAKEYPQPVKSIMNLTTSCSQLKFNSTSEILAMSSSNEPRAVKLLHVTSRTIFSNFPERGKSLSTVTSLDFSRNSGYLCLGQQNGTASLYRLTHFPDF